jgi:phage N-6-adenine-methyltransferase
MQPIQISSSYEGWETPPALFAALNREFNFDLDVAANERNALCDLYYNVHENGLVQPWAPHRIFCNPPRCREKGMKTEDWVYKAIEEARKGALVVMLLRVATDTQWFYDLWCCAEIRFMSGRVQYLRNGVATGGCTFASFLAILQPGLPEPLGPILLPGIPGEIF